LRGVVGREGVGGVVARRFTDTEKYNDPWFRKLPVLYKQFFDYLCARCDNAGVWKVDMELAAFQIGEQINPEEALVLLNGRVNVLNADYWHVPGFVSFQFGKLSPDCKPHKSIIQLIEKHKNKGYPKGIHTLKDKDKDSSKDKDNAFGTENNFNALWDLYPNKDGRKDALRHFRATVTTEQDLTDIHAAIKNYINSQKVKDGFVKNGSTWFNNWRDWINVKPIRTDIPQWMQTNKTL
jgi:hypothetical protein